MGAIYNTDQFTFDPKEKQFISEASDLQLELKQIFNDSCDEGLELVSRRTGEVSKWYLNKTEYTNGPDRELVAWHLIPTPQSIKNHPGLKGYKMVIFND